MVKDHCVNGDTLRRKSVHATLLYKGKSLQWGSGGVLGRANRVNCSAPTPVHFSVCGRVNLRSGYSNRIIISLTQEMSIINPTHRTYFKVAMIMTGFMRLWFCSFTDRAALSSRNLSLRLRALRIYGFDVADRAA